MSNAGNWDLWKHLRGRYETPAPRRLLTLDGGGIRGIITLEILEEIEAQVRSANGKDTRLCQFFDYIAGTSTGAIIAAALALGKSIAEIKKFYWESGAEMFDSATLLNKWKFLYNKQPLEDQLKHEYGSDSTLEPQHLKTLLMVVLKNVTTDSPWPVSSNPFGKYNEPNRLDCNLRIPLWKIVRASTAAPVFFPPEVIDWGNGRIFLFVDGGVTPYNNPAFQLYKMATHPAYKLGWEVGEKNLLLVSVGTGIAPSAAPFESSNTTINLLQNMKTLPPDLMYAIQVEQDLNCRMLGRCSYGTEIDRELGDLIPRDSNGKLIPLSTDTGKPFTYIRYNADLDDDSLSKLGLSKKDAARARAIDSVESIEQLGKIGKSAAKQVSKEHFGSFIQLKTLSPQT